MHFEQLYVYPTHLPDDGWFLVAVSRLLLVPAGGVLSPVFCNGTAWLSSLRARRTLHLFCLVTSGESCAPEYIYVRRGRFVMCHA